MDKLTLAAPFRCTMSYLLLHLTFYLHLYLMRWLVTLAKAAFICNIAFLLCLLISVTKNFIPSEMLKGLVIILGLVLSFAVNFVVHIVEIVLAAMRRLLRLYFGCGRLTLLFLHYKSLTFSFIAMPDIFKDKSSTLFIAITAFFVSNALIAECIGTKIFSLEKLFGFAPANISLFGQSGLSFNLTCGVLLWPLEFVITDIVNEYYGIRAVRRISYTAVALISYAFLMFYASIHLPAADFWIGSKQPDGVSDMRVAFDVIFGQGLWIIVGSLTAFLVSQIIDVTIFHRIKKVTGSGKVWLRATGSTLVSQLVDSFIVLIIAFKLGSNWTWTQVIAVAILNYSYKSVMAIILTPVIYFAEGRIDKYLGKEKAAQMKANAMQTGATKGLQDIPVAG